MALSIKTDEADALARELATLTHESLTEAVTTALRERLERVRDRKPVMMARLRKLQEEYAAHAGTDDRPEDEIVGYNDIGAFD